MTLGAHAGALLLIFVLPIGLLPQFGLAGLIAISLWWQGRYGVLACRGEIRLEEDGSCLRIVNNKQRRYRITRATTHAGFIRLMLKRADGRTCPQLVPRDAVEPEIYRALRSWIVQRRLAVSDQRQVSQP